MEGTSLSSQVCLQGPSQCLLSLPVVVVAAAAAAAAAGAGTWEEATSGTC